MLFQLISESVMVALFLVLVSAGILLTPGGNTTDMLSGKVLFPEGGPVIKDKTAGFTIQLPDGFSKPQKGSTKVPSAIGKLTMHSYTSMLGDDKVCMVGYSKYPPIAFNGQSLNTMYDNARDGAVKNSGGTLDKEEDITVDGQPGRRIYVSMNGQGQEMHSRFEYVAHKPHLIFNAMVTTAQSDLNTPEADAYFSSMKFNQK